MAGGSRPVSARPARAARARVSCDNERPMTLRRAVLGLVLASMALAAARGARAQYPEPRVRGEPDALGAAAALYDAGRWEEAADAFEAAARDGAVALPASALRRWGIAASEASRPLTAYVRLRQYLALEAPPDREGLTERTGRARDAVVAAAARFSRLMASSEQQPYMDGGG